MSLNVYLCVVLGTCISCSVHPQPKFSDWNCHLPLDLQLIVQGLSWSIATWIMGCYCQSSELIIIIIFWLKHQYLKHKYQSMVQQIIANMLSETVYTGITNLYIITKNQQNTKQYIINVNSVF